MVAGEARIGKLLINIAKDITLGKNGFTTIRARAGGLDTLLAQHVKAFQLLCFLPQKKITRMFRLADNIF